MVSLCCFNLHFFEVDGCGRLIMAHSQRYVYVLISVTCECDLIRKWVLCMCYYFKGFFFFFFFFLVKDLDGEINQDDLSGP